MGMIRADKSKINCLAPQETAPASSQGNPDNTATVYDARTGMPLYALKGHVKGAQCGGILSGRNADYHGSDDGTAKL